MLRRGLGRSKLCANGRRKRTRRLASRRLLWTKERTRRNDSGFQSDLLENDPGFDKTLPGFLFLPRSSVLLRTHSRNRALRAVQFIAASRVTFRPELPALPQSYLREFA